MLYIPKVEKLVAEEHYKNFWCFAGSTGKASDFDPCNLS